MTDQPTDGGVIRTARLNSLGVLLTRITNGLTLTQDEARLLVGHIDIEVRESTTARELARAAPLPSIHANDVAGFCPACGHGVLMLGDGGHVVCTLIDCPDPDAVDKLLTRTDDAGDDDAVAPTCWHTEADSPCDWDVCRQPERLAASDPGTDPAMTPPVGPVLRQYPDERREMAETDTQAIAHAEAVRQMDADPTQPHTGLVIQPYRHFGQELWLFRCWGTTDGTCDGWLGLGHHTRQSAERERDRHVAEDHCECGGTLPHPDCPVHTRTTEPTTEQH
ncbi:DUF6085 family protein [Streptomyces sp. NPDC048504]|uniref:DUF6085 family protein n=1 Tax=Streptomyces sp. NPDC048504 TaxID=3365559 RepID=UPI0037233653